MVPERKNRDLFANLKAMSWWALRLRFQSTYRAIVEGMPYEADSLISIDPHLEELLPLTMELSQPTYKLNTAGKIIVNKAPDGTRSPNCADAVMIAFNPTPHVLDLWLRAAGIEWS
jgi:phage terminase large subunit